MSFSLTFNARSKSHALSLLGQREQSVPAAVHAFLKSAIEGIGPQAGSELRLIEVSATGHLADGNSYAVSSGTLKVQPHFAPD